MKTRIITTVILLSFGLIGRSQQASIGLEVAIPFADLSTTQGFGIGATGKFHIPIQEKLQVTITTGYISFAGKDNYNAFGILPLKAGMRFDIGNAVFIEPEVGLWFGNHGYGSSFAYGAGVYKSLKNFDLGIRAEGSSKDGGNYWFFGLRAAYKFDLNIGK